MVLSTDVGKTSHIAIRIGSLIDTKSGRRDSIKAHNAVIARSPSASFGKFGKPLNETILTKLNKQIDEDIPTYLYVIRKEGKS